VPVVDRGPFARGVSYDLTFATAQALGFQVTDRVGALPVGPPPAPAAP
jgi:rare lipoprotein A (peptidoglycan hydrolase)